MPVVDKIEREKLAANYGFALAFMKSDKELWRLFNKAVAQTWDANRFIAKLRDTKWFKKNSASVRNAIMQEKADPATYRANVDKMYATVRDTWGSMFGTADMSQKQLRSWAETAHRMGWSEAELVDRMTQGVNYQKLMTRKNLGGTAAEAKAQVDALVANYGVNLGDTWKSRQLEKLMEGDDTIAGVQSRVRDLAKREYAAFAEQIEAGATVSELADPYRQMMADLLEVNPRDIEIKDSMIQRAMRQKTKDGKPAALSLNDFGDMVRKDKRWQYTDNAREQVASVTEGLLRQFGLRA